MRPIEFEPSSGRPVLTQLRLQTELALVSLPCVDRYLQDLSIIDDTSGLIVKPKRYLGKEWGSVKGAIKKLGESWIQTSEDERMA